MALASQSAATPPSVCRQWTLVRDWILFVPLDLNELSLLFCFPELVVILELPRLAGLWVPPRNFI